MLILCPIKVVAYDVAISRNERVIELWSMFFNIEREKLIRNWKYYTVSRSSKIYFNFNGLTFSRMSPVRAVPREMENNSRRHTKKAHISRPRSILIDKEIHSVRDSRPISNDGSYHEQWTNERLFDSTIVIIAHKKVYVVLAEICEHRERSTLEAAETWFRRSKYDRSAISVYSIFDVIARSATDDEISGGACNFIKRQSSGCQWPRERARGRSAAVGKRETRCTTLSSDIDLSVSVFDVMRKKKEVHRGLLTFPQYRPASSCWCASYSFRRSVHHLFSKSLRGNPSFSVNSLNFLSIEVVRKDSLDLFCYRSKNYNYG